MGKRQREREKEDGKNNRGKMERSRYSERGIISDREAVWSEKTMHNFQKQNSMSTHCNYRHSVQPRHQTAPHSFTFTFFYPALPHSGCIRASHPRQSAISQRSPGGHVRSALEAFSHLPLSGAEVNPKDLPFSGTKFSSLTCVKVFITLLVISE